MANNLDARPNKSNLSYLIYYASTRRTKLDKVGSFLVKKTRHDALHNRVGNLQVTLYIVQELINKCSDDLGILTPYILQLLQLCVGGKDLTVCQCANETYVQFAQKLQPQQAKVFTSRDVYSEFIAVSSTFINFGNDANTDNKLLRTTRDDWLRIGLRTANAVAQYVDPIYSQPSASKTGLIGSSTKMLLDTIVDTKPDLDLTPPVSTSTTGSSASRTSNDDTGQMALDALKEFFDTGDKRQVDSTTKAVIDYSLRNDVDVYYLNRLLTVCAKKTHIELRYRMVSSIIVEIENTEDPDTKIYLYAVVSNLLSSEDVNLVGLPVKNILTHILVSQKALASVDDQLTYDHLSSAYLDIVSALGKHIYYNTQLNTMITVILSYYQQVSSSPSEKMDSGDFVDLSKLMICDIEEVAQTAGEDTYLKYKRAYYPFNLFNYLYYALSLTRYDGSETVPLDDRNRIRMAWFTVLHSFYQNDPDTEHMQTPNAEMVITSGSDNPLCLYIDLVSRISEEATEPLLGQIWETTKVLLEAMQINFLINFLKFSNAWLVKEGSFKFNLALMVLYKSAIVLNIPELETYVGERLNALYGQDLIQPYFAYTPSKAVGDAKVDRAELLQIYKSTAIIDAWLPYTGIEEATLNDPETPDVSQMPPSRIPRACDNTLYSTASIKEDKSSILPKANAFARAERSRTTSQISGISALANQSFARTMSSTHTRTSVRELVSIATGVASVEPSLNSISLDERDEDCVTPNGETRSYVPHKKSGLAYCLTNLSLTDSEDDDKGQDVLSQSSAIETQQTVQAAA